jgi:hypothetical protein
LFGVVIFSLIVLNLYFVYRQLLYRSLFILKFQDLKNNEARLQELNTIADKLTVLGRTEAAEKIREQIAVSSTFTFPFSFK